MREPASGPPPPRELAIRHPSSTTSSASRQQLKMASGAWRGRGNRRGAAGLGSGASMHSFTGCTGLRGGDCMLSVAIASEFDLAPCFGDRMQLHRGRVGWNVHRHHRRERGGCWTACFLQGSPRYGIALFEQVDRPRHRGSRWQATRQRAQTHASLPRICLLIMGKGAYYRTGMLARRGP